MQIRTSKTPFFTQTSKYPKLLYTLVVKLEKHI